VVLMGSAIGIAAGARLGMGQAALYGEFYRFPFMHYVLRPEVAVTGVLVSALAAVAGTLTAVMRAAGLPPAQGMRPDEPPRFRRTVLDRGTLRALLSPPARMVLRNILRRPLKSTLTVIGVALAGAVLVVGGFMWSAVDFMLDVQFSRSLRADLTVTFAEITGHKVLHELSALPGVRQVEPFRMAPVKLRYGHREERLALQGLVADAELRRTLNDRYAPVTLRGGGLLLTDHLAAKLGLAPGDTVSVERLDGRRSIRELSVTGQVGELTGHNAYMNIDALNAWLGDGDAVSGAFLQVDAGALDALYARLKNIPQVVGVMNRRAAMNSFNDTMGENLLMFAFINLCMASTIAVGVVYNSMRTALSERAHELASLRVLGYTQAEAAYVLLGEIVLLTLVAIPAGALIGYGFCALLAHSLASDLFRVPLALAPHTYANAAVAVIGATALSALAMVHHLRRLDLVSALKVPQ
ncbi:MAG: ABC transporter permease, partial [Metallibacterium scheffleri]|uniref:ABC transporter permease n=1 Tax=Metallibacterium scheffleri TaxID=993689 RepID=UPI0026E945F9